MHKTTVLALSICLARSALAGDVPAPDITALAAGSATGPGGGSASGRLNEKERRAAELARQWIEEKALPVREEDGKIVYLFGATLPSVICKPLMLCDIELQAGEKIEDVLVGDTLRWKVQPGKSLSGPGAAPHIVVKPTESGLTTSMVVTTDRRTYHLKLMSQSKGWMPRVGFAYQSDIAREWQAYYAKEGQRRERNTIPETKENVERLDFEYEIDGDAPWKPLRVYNDGVKTYIQMPREMAQTEAPALLVIGSSGNQQIVNYRLKKDRYIVDQIFAKAVLIAGVGNDQTLVEIERTRERK